MQLVAFSSSFGLISRKETWQKSNTEFLVIKNLTGSSESNLIQYCSHAAFVILYNILSVLL